MELVVTLVLFGIILGLVAQTMLFHQRLQRRLQSVNAASRAARQATAILANVLGDAASTELLAGQSSDSAVELMASVGAGVGCVSGTELRTAEPGAGGDASLVAFAAVPKPGDRVLVFDGRLRPPRWRARSVVELVPALGSCAPAGTPPESGITLLLDSTLDAPPVAAFRILRRTRYDLYRGGDRRWYLGMREWNAQAQAFNAVQPVAGPLRAHSVSANATGLRFEYFDSAGGPAGVPSGSTRVARVAITARGADTMAVVSQRSVALRRAP